MTARKISYRTTTLERSLPVDRSVVWRAVTTQAAGRADGVDLGPGAGPVTEVVLSDEPPWRRVVLLDGDHPSETCQTSVTIRDDGERSLVAWSCLIDPTGLRDDEIDALVDAVAADGSRQLDAIARAATGG